VAVPIQFSSEVRVFAIQEKKVVYPLREVAVVDLINKPVIAIIELILRTGKEDFAFAIYVVRHQGHAPPPERRSPRPFRGKKSAHFSGWNTFARFKRADRFVDCCAFFRRWDAVVSFRGVTSLA
jgi:hypothetical protein